MKSPYTDEVFQSLQKFGSKYKCSDLSLIISELCNLKVLVIGETIIDEYIYCDALGKSGKEAMLALKYCSKSRQAGGVLAIANHISDFCKEATIVSYLGDCDSDEEFVRDSMKSNIKPYFIYKSDSPTITKRRFLDRYSMAKLLGVYKINDEMLNEREESEMCLILSDLVRQHDLVIIADYDHGLFTKKIIDLLTAKANFLSVNTQVNAANIGFHAISKYAKADYICIHEGEVRMDCRSRKGDLKELVLNLANKMNCGKILVTRGSNGSLLYCKDEGFSSCPALATRVVDRIGAGDAVLAITSLLAATKTPSDIIAFIGNVVGAEAVAIVGNERKIERERLLASIADIMKGQ